VRKELAKEKDLRTISKRGSSLPKGDKGQGGSKPVGKKAPLSSKEKKQPQFLGGKNGDLREGGTRPRNLYRTLRGMKPAGWKKNRRKTLPKKAPASNKGALGEKSARVRFSTRNFLEQRARGLGGENRRREKNPAARRGGGRGKPQGLEEKRFLFNHTRTSEKKRGLLKAGVTRNSLQGQTENSSRVRRRGHYLVRGGPKTSEEYLKKIYSSPERVLSNATWKKRGTRPKRDQGAESRYGEVCSTSWKKAGLRPRGGRKGAQ